MLIGIWLEVAPDVLGFEGTSANNDYIIGPLVASFSIIAISEVTRGAKRLNTILGLGLFFAPMLFHYNEVTALVNDMLAGILIVIFSFKKGKRKHRFGDGWKAIWKNNTLHERMAGNFKK
jgi:hypothetical protein